MKITWKLEGNMKNTCKLKGNMKKYMETGEKI